MFLFWKRSAAILTLACYGVVAEPSKISTADIRPILNEMMSLHVEYGQFSSLIAKRSIKLFIEQFDPFRMYLLSSEIEPFLSMPEGQTANLVHAFYNDNFSVYMSLMALFERAINRVRALREEAYQEILASGSYQPAARTDGYSNYAKTAGELKSRLYMQLLAMIDAEKRADARIQELNKEVICKIFTLWQKRIARGESKYLLSMQSAIDQQHKLALAVVKSQAKSLDSHSMVFSPEEAFEMRASLEKQFEGVGIVLREGIEGVYVAGVVGGGPAERSGKVQVGDVLLQIDASMVEKASYEEILALLKGTRGSKVSIVLLRDGKQVKVDLVREKIVMQDQRVQYSFEDFEDGIIGKITLPAFYESSSGLSCERDLKEAIKGLRQRGALKGLVIDMRENAGGFLSQAVKVAGLFITSGVVVISKYSKGEMQYLRDIDGRIYYDGPLVLLTSKASASAAEIVAQALQDYGVALVVGDERTYGKGTIQYQTVTDELANNFYKVTVGRYYTVSGRSTQIEGVHADIIVPTSYAPYPIGEKYLAYPLKNDQVAPAYADPLLDIDYNKKSWFQKNYLPLIQKRSSLWTQLLPELKSRSRDRVKTTPELAKYLSSGDLQFSEDIALERAVDVKDPQMKEAVLIIEDMIVLSKKKN